jgi:hypothetical protein
MTVSSRHMYYSGGAAEKIELCDRKLIAASLVSMVLLREFRVSANQFG